jgi:hypothetical protein
MESIYRSLVGLIGVGFAIFFFVTIGPLFFQQPDLIAAFKAGYVNPYSLGFATDAIACWLILVCWVIYKKLQKGIKHGLLAIMLGFVPGVATGFAVYLLLRSYQQAKS